MKKLFEILSILFLIVTAITLIALQMKPLGFYLLAAGAIATLFTSTKFRRDILLIYVSLSILSFTPINTDISYYHMFEMGLALILAVAIPYVVSRYLYKDHAVRFPWHHGRRWYKSEIWYIIITATIAYFLLPFMLRSTGSYLNWTVEPGVENLIKLFIGTNALGIWDELFFISTVLALLRRHLPFTAANIVQGVLFTSFLYELGFQGWIFIIIYIFALIQGYIFKKTESLLYVITVHLTFDLILYLVLIYLHHPSWLPIFVT
jgi:membrane protease YdiL (CAAX protease family)